MKTFLATIFLSILLVGCGGGGGSSPSSNQVTTTQINPKAVDPIPVRQIANSVPVVVDGTYASLNAPYVSVTVCQPGTTNCAIVDHVLVDTGSVGLRLLKSALPSTMNLVNASDPNTRKPLGECGQFGSGFTWGSVSAVDLTIAGETAASVPTQLIDDTYASIPSSCSDAGADMGALGTASLGAKGILGVGVMRSDCGSLCASVSTSLYYDCPNATCNEVVMQDAGQLPNPVSYFSGDNNGVVLTFPSIPAIGANTAAGTMTFGVNTQADNNLAGLTQLSVQSNDTLLASFNGQSMLGIVDSGSGAFVFPDPSITQCPSTFSPQPWFCPTSTLTLSASLFDTIGHQQQVSFDIGNAVSLFTASGAAYSNVGLDQSLFGLSYFDLGMSYFYGKTIYFGMEGPNAATSPYVAVKS